MNIFYIFILSFGIIEICKYRNRKVKIHRKENNGKLSTQMIVIEDLGC